MIGYINKETLEVYNNPGEVRKALAPFTLPKVLTKAVLTARGLDYLYDTARPAINQFQRLKKTGVALIDDKYQVTYDVEEAFDAETKAELIATTTEQLKTAQISSLKTALDKKINDFLVGNALTEQLSWSKQEDEASAWLADNTIETPYIDTLLVTRDNGETKEDLVNKILAKATAYAVFHASALGDFHKKLEEIKAVTVQIDTFEDNLNEIRGVTLIDLEQSV